MILSFQIGSNAGIIGMTKGKDLLATDFFFFSLSLHGSPFTSLELRLP